MKVEVRYPDATVGASGMRLFVNDLFIPRVKEIRVKQPDFKQTELGYEAECKGIKLIDDNGGLIAIIIKENEE